jgi:hypothetical protein
LKMLKRTSCVMCAATPLHDAAQLPYAPAQRARHHIP